MQHDSSGQERPEFGRSAATRAATAEPNTADSTSSRCGSVVRIEALGATKSPHTIANVSGAPIPSIQRDVGPPTVRPQ